MDTLVISIPGCGTRFLADLLGCNSVHIEIEDIPDTIIAVPLRNPRDVLKTWIKRNRDINIFAGRWQRLQRLSNEYTIYPVALDLPIRDKQVQRLSEALERPLAPDWSKRLGHAEGNPELPDFDWSEISALPLVARFYADDRGQFL
ncbi:MAG: hypothetical protein GY938_05460 [Ketobacter sp.]|nr:hypothetical protein [Ketobacter sp.]